MNLLLILGIGIALLFLLWAAGRNRSAAGADRASRPADPGEYIVRLPPRALLARCLAVEDLEFAVQTASIAVVRLLLRERRRLALAWLRQTRQEAGRLFRLHVRMARHAPDLRPAAEGKLLLQFGLFLVVYQILVGFVALYGPLRTRRFVESVHALADLLSRLGSRIAESASARSVSPADGLAGV